MCFFDCIILFWWIESNVLFLEVFTFEVRLRKLVTETGRMNSQSPAYFGLWNPEFSSRNPESHWTLESRIKFYWQGMQDLVPGIQNPWRGFQSPTILNFLMRGEPRGEHSMIEWIRKKTTLFTWAVFAGALESGKLADCCKVHSGYWSRTWTFSLNICANSLKLKAACRFPRDLARLEACLISFMSS